MLVLTRKANERIVIGKDESIVITLLSCTKRQARLGISAASDIPVIREELLIQRKSAEDEDGSDNNTNNNTTPSSEVTPLDQVMHITEEIEVLAEASAESVSEHEGQGQVKTPEYTNKSNKPSVH